MVLNFALPVALDASFTSTSRRGAPAGGAPRRWPVVTVRLQVPRLSALRVSSVLVTPGVSSPSARASTGQLSPTWGSWSLPSSGLVATRLATFCSETQRAWSASLQSLQHVGRQASRMLRSSSWGRHLAVAAAGAEEMQAAAATAAAAGGDGAPDADEPTLQQFQASLAHFLTSATRAEVRHAALLATLSDMAYDIPTNVQPDALRALGGLRLVATSLTSGATRQPPSGQQPLRRVRSAAAVEGMDRRGGASSAAGVGRTGAPAPHVLNAAQLGAFSGFPVGAMAAGHVPMPLVAPGCEPLEVSAVPLAAATAAPSAWDCDALSSLSECDGSHFGTRMFDASITWDNDCWDGDGGAVHLPLSPRRAMVVGAMSVLDAPPSDADEAEAAVPEEACFGATRLRGALRRVASAPAAFCAGADAPAPGAAEAAAAAQAEGALPPSAWFVCDDDSAGGAPTRTFVIQGSISLDHWRINLTIDPTDFGDASFGIKVHRGVYEAAELMYPAFVPLVEAHLAAHPDGRVVLTGHSLGGSLATVLMLLLVHRGVLPPAAVGGVRTFGAPAVFCEGAVGGGGGAAAGSPCVACALACEHRAARTAAAAASEAPASTEGLLERLGLERGCVRNVIMHRDLVPRAFVCDYTIVADVLKSWVPSFKHHTGLAACKSHKVLYNFLGDVEVLQPDPSCGFMLPDEDHCMLPPGADLFKLTEPSCALPTAAAMEGSGGGAPGQGQEDGGGNPLHLTLSDAILAFMNSPHPLNTLCEMRAYGSAGSISRFHNPAHYAHALRLLLP